MKAVLAKIISAPVIGIGTYFLLNIIQPDENVSRMAGIAVWMALWWMLEAVPMAVTALLPVFLFPLGGILNSNEIARLYMNDVLMLFMGGFFVALAMEKWNLHKRIALHIIKVIGTDLHKILFGLMLATYLLSMWVSNTATVLMMLPTILAIITRIEGVAGIKNTRSGIAMLLGLAYAASIGGLATLVGTPTNLIFVSQFKALYPDQAPVTFLQWSLFGIPFSFTLLILCYLLLV